MRFKVFSAALVVVAAAMATVAWTERPEAVSIPTVYVGETPNDRTLHVPLEFYVNGEDLDPNQDVLAPFDYINLTPSCASRKIASTPTLGFSFVPIHGAVCLAQVKVIYGNSLGVYEKIIQAQIVPAGSITLEVEDARFYPPLYNTGYEDP